MVRSVNLTALKLSGDMTFYTHKKNGTVSYLNGFIINYTEKKGPGKVSFALDLCSRELWVAPGVRT